MCLLLVCCISWRYKTYATTTTSTTKTPAAAIKTTRTILLYWYHFVHTYIESLDHHVFSPGLLWFKGWGAVHSHVAVTLLESVELPWELKLARRIQKGRDLNGCVHTQTRQGILAVFLYIRYMIMICTCVSYVFLYTYDDWCVCLWQ